MEFPGTWVNHSQTLAYRVIPKCACSTVGQILYHGDHGRFYPGDVHDDDTGIWKWNNNPDLETARSRIVETVLDPAAIRFTCVRNPYARVLSAFFDKICSVQRNGQRYRGDLVPDIAKKYGMQIDGDFDQIAAFRKFLLFVRDTVKFRKPIPPDIHWAPMANHAATLVRNGGRFDAVFAIEAFEPGMSAVLDRVELSHRPDLAQLPRFNESEGLGPRRAHAVEEYFDDLATHIVTEVYRKDFRIFGYDWTPGTEAPRRARDIDDINDRLARL